MIELPEAVTLARDASKALDGRTVISVVANAAPHRQAWFLGDPSAYPALLGGATFRAAQAHGGFVELDAGTVQLLVAEDVGVRLWPAGAARPQRHQLLLELDDGSALTVTVRLYGGIWAHRSRDGFDDPYFARAKTAPSPLSGAFDGDYFDGLTDVDAHRGLSLKALLAAGQRVPGLGNGVLQDVLFAARLHPRRLVASLDGEERARLFEAVTGVLCQMTRNRGRDSERDLFGEPGRYRTTLGRHAVGRACPCCGATIVKEQYLGGAVYACPCCQRRPEAPTVRSPRRPGTVVQT
jgi:formamidopyrimidine-DNA glycosylase